MLKDAFQYGVEIYKNDGTLLGQAPVSPDWAPAFEWTAFQGIRSGRLDPAAPSLHGRVEPVWHPEKGPPYTGSFRVSISGGADQVCEDFPLSYFRKVALKAATQFVELSDLEAGDTIQFRATAFERQDTGPPAPRRIVIDDEDLREPWPIIQASMPGKDAPAPDAADVPVFIPAALLDDVAALTRAAGPVETGGVLIGRLCQDSSAREIFLDVTGHIPARHTIAEVAKLTFTGDTWTDARNLIGLRGRGEIMLGWWHSHVGREYCKDCPADRQRECKFAKGFFSAHDEHFHRTAFSRAYHVGLVVNDPAAGEVTFPLFGWRRGRIEARDFCTNGESHVANSKAC